MADPDRPADSSSRRSPIAWLFVGTGAALLGLSVVLTALGAESRFLPFHPASELAEPLLQTDPRAEVAVIAAPSRSTDNPPSPSDAVWAIELAATEPALERGLWDRLAVDAAGEVRDLELRPGAAVDVGETKYRVAAVRTWRGLLPIEDGRPAASVTVFGSDNVVVEDLWVEDGQRVDIEGGPAVELAWHADAAASRRAAGDPKANQSGARWGVADGSRVQWFGNFEPGTGVTLADGTVVLLEQFFPSGEDGGPGGDPVLIVRRGVGNEAKRLRIVGESDEPPVFAQYPGGNGPVIRLNAHEAGRAYVALQHEGRFFGPVELEAGESWHAAGAPFGVRLEQSLPSAAQVTEPMSPFFEAVLESPEGRLRVRQGEAVRAGDALLRYVRRSDYASTAFRVRLHGGSDGPETFVLYPHERETLGIGGEQWLLSHADVKPGDGVLLRQRAGAARWVRLTGLVILVSGLIALMMRRPAAR